MVLISKGRKVSSRVSLAGRGLLGFFQHIGELHSLGGKAQGELAVSEAAFCLIHTGDKGVLAVLASLQGFNDQVGLVGGNEGRNLSHAGYLHGLIVKGIGGLDDVLGRETALVGGSRPYSQ